MIKKVSVDCSFCAKEKFYGKQSRIVSKSERLLDEALNSAKVKLTKITFSDYFKAISKLFSC